MFLIALLVSGAVLTKNVDAVNTGFESLDDDREDGFDFGSCISNGLLEPATACVDLLELKISCHNYTYMEYYESTISFNVVMAEDMPLDVPVVLEVAFDTDMDATTGQSQPECYYNGMGADWRVRVEVQEGVVLSSSIDKYRSKGWSISGEPLVEVGPASIKVEFLRSDLGDLVSSRVMVFAICEDVVDMLPDIGDEPHDFSLVFPPIACLEAPSTIPEGFEVLFNALPSMAFDHLGNPDRIENYMFDLDGDGVYEHTGYPLVAKTYPDDGVVTVTLQVEDALGLTDAINQTIAVTNMPPIDLRISTVRELFKGVETSFHGEAYDVEADDLTYRWDFGDGATAEGDEVTHVYRALGSYNVTLVVSDKDGGSCELTEVFEVLKKPVRLPGSFVVSWVSANRRLLLFGLLGVVGIVAFLLLVKSGVIEIEIIEEDEGGQGEAPL